MKWAMGVLIIYCFMSSVQLLALTSGTWLFKAKLISFDDKQVVVSLRERHFVVPKESLQTNKGPFMTGQEVKILLSNDQLVEQLAKSYLISR